MGTPINENLRMEMQEYLRYPALSSSALACADESMLKYRASKTGQLRYESKAMDVGTAVHTMIEDCTGFQHFYVVKPTGMDYRTKEGKAFKEEHEDMTIIDQETFNTVWGCYESWQTSDDPLIRIARESPGEAEISRFWHQGDLLCKARADRLVDVQGADNEYLHEHWPSLFNPISNQIVVDFKTTSRGASPRSFGYAMRDFRYALKAAFYLDGFQADAFLWVVLETSPPFHITRYLMSPASVDFYTERMKVLMEQIAECEKTGIYPGLVISDEETLL